MDDLDVRALPAQSLHDFGEDRAAARRWMAYEEERDLHGAASLGRPPPRRIRSYATSIDRKNGSSGFSLHTSRTTAAAPCRRSIC
jgi:hypothetical protein